LFFVVNIIFRSLAVLLLSSNSLDYQWFRRMGTQSRRSACNYLIISNLSGRGQAKQDR